MAYIIRCSWITRCTNFVRVKFIFYIVAIYETFSFRGRYRLKIEFMAKLISREKKWFSYFVKRELYEIFNWFRFKLYQRSPSPIVVSSFFSARVQLYGIDWKWLNFWSLRKHFFGTLRSFIKRKPCLHPLNSCPVIRNNPDFQHFFPLSKCLVYRIYL